MLAPPSRAMPSRARARARRALALAAPALVAAMATIVACGDSGTAPLPPVPAVVDLRAIPTDLEVGDSLRLGPLARVADARGGPLAGLPITWEVTDSTVATIDDGDRLVALEDGAVIVRASVPVEGGSISGNRPVAVRALVRTLALSARTDSLGIGDTVTIASLALDARGRTLPRERVSVASSDSTVLRLDPRTLVARAVGDGTARVVAEGDGVRREVTVTVHLARLALGADVVRQLAVGDTHACALVETREAICWGANDRGQLGLGGAAPGPGGVSRVAGGLRFADVDAQQSTSCGVADDGAAWCWGEYSHAELPRTAPALVPRPAGASPAARVRIGRSGAVCSVGTAGDAACWGNNASLLLAREPASSRDMTVLGVDGATRWRSIDGGYDHACGVTTAGTLACWGIIGRVLPGAQTSASPVRVGDGTRWAQVVSGVDFSCALDDEGVASCFGIDDVGQLGRGTTHSVFAPQAPAPVAGGLRFASLHAGDRYACGLTATGAAWCWGSGARGTGRALEPVEFSRLLRFETFAAGARGACGVTAAGSVHCVPAVVAPSGR